MHRMIERVLFIAVKGSLRRYAPLTEQPTVKCNPTLATKEKWIALACVRRPKCVSGKNYSE